MSADYSIEKLDYIFVGSGTSATLLLMSMEKNGLLTDKKIGIIDPDEKSINDKTFCFWISENEKSTLLCAPLISKEWNRFRRQNGNFDEERSLSYNMVRSSDLYAEMKRIISDYDIFRSHETVSHLETSDDGVVVTTNLLRYHAQLVFDSRPPEFLPPQSHESHLQQSFFGYFISLENQNQEHEMIDLMDFNVAQAYETQFFYVLPFDETNLLVELTRFGSQPINEENATILLNDYILKRFGNYTITAVERGNIPMSTSAITSESHPNVVMIGARSGAIKPSTGYAFKNMMHHAEQISAALLAETKPVFSRPTNRFKRYDRLLLKILSDKPYLGKPIFQQLFSKNETSAVFRFLDEKSTLKEELKMFSTLPIKPFLSAFIVDVFKAKKRDWKPVLLLVIAFSLLAVQQINSIVFEWTNNLLLLIGLLAIGIPHGAVDHLLTSDKKNTRPTFGFIVRYLSSAFILFILWMIAPKLSLVLFLLYSSWHFGESDVFHWGITKNKAAISWIWGSVVLLLILSTHFNETNEIIRHFEINFPIVVAKYAPFFSGGLVLFALILVRQTKNVAMLLSLVLLIVASQLPLLTAFGLYFIGQHSINSWIHIKKGLEISNKQFFLRALPFTLGAFFLFGILIYCIKNELIELKNYNWVAFVFIFISCISLPHILVIHGFYKAFLKNKNKLR
jgi:lycopene beta-cyclase